MPERSAEGPPPAADEAVALEVHGISRDFPGVRAVDGLSFVARRGEIIGLLGHNGAGKTTTIRVLNGLLRPTEGTATVLGLDPATHGPDVRARTGVLTETPSVDERLTARENLRFAARLAGVRRDEVNGRVSELLERFRLSDRADDRVAEFSRGMKQRLALARALLHNPEVLFLDEPTAALDPVAARDVHDLIRRLWVGPAVASLALGVLVQVSARVRGFQEAYQLGGAIVLPIVALIVAQLAGVLVIDAGLAILLGAVVWILAAGTLWLGYRSFRRERLLLST
jgi:ABC-type Na+ transport system ATPase subunit NatA